MYIDTSMKKKETGWCVSQARCQHASIPSQSAFMLTIRQLTFNAIAEFGGERRKNMKMRNDPIPAELTDLYVERISVSVLNVWRCGVGLKVGQQFKINLPVLIECDGLVITGNVRHCVKAADGGYVLGMKILRIVDTIDLAVTAYGAGSG